MSAFRLQVVTEQGEVAACWRPGEQAEIDLVQSVADRVATKPVGVFRTTSAVRAQVQAAMLEVLHDLKRTVRPPA